MEDTGRSVMAHRPHPLSKSPQTIPPQTLIVDQGTAFVADEFMTRAEAIGILIEIIDREKRFSKAIQSCCDGWKTCPQQSNG